MLPKKLPYDEFIKSFEFVPRVAVNLLVTDNEKRVLLAQRSIEPLTGYWHLPGSFLLKGEKIDDCIRRVVKDEMGMELSDGSWEFAGVFEDIDKDPRGHVIDLVYKIELKNISSKAGEGTKEIKFFKELPPDIGFSHSEILHELGF